MRARLGLSIASVIEPDVLLLDEIVATADEEYRARSEARFRDLARRAGAIVVVTHDVRWIAEFCSRAVLVEHGRLIADGAPADLLERYREVAATGDGSTAPSPCLTRRRSDSAGGHPGRHHAPADDLGTLADP
jgi:ABC-type polysaccharide/polyol phosphate transport system ATPase subunit